jgi:hypothetical protein
MALPSLAARADLEVWLGVTLVGTEATRADAAIAHASGSVRATASRAWVDAAGTALLDVPNGIPELVVRVAARMYANPTGNESETTGPFAVKYGPQDLTDAERSQVAALVRAAEASATAPTTGLRGLFTIRTTREVVETPGPWVNVQGSAPEWALHADTDPSW